jgi:putative hemolysin
MSETAFMSLSKIRIRNMQETGVPGADKIARLIYNPGKMLNAILVGNNLVNIAAASTATILAQKYFQNSAAAIATGVTTLLVLVFGEITPKYLAVQNSDKIALLVVNFVDILVKVLSPVLFILNIITSGLIKLFGGNATKEAPIITEAEFKTLVDVGHEEGVFEEEEKEMINNVFDFGNTVAKDVMIARTDITAVENDSTYDEIYEIFKEEGFTRLPIYEDSMDNIIGVINFRDFILNVTDKERMDLTNILREVYFTYESKPTAELFKIMRSKRYSIAIVLDEYGGTSGLITVEDLVEEIVGDIDDEYDEPKDEIFCVKEDEYVLDGSVRLDDVNDMIGTHLESEDFDTIGGYIIGLLGRFPDSNEIVESGGNRYIIEDVDKNRITKIRMYTSL